MKCTSKVLKTLGFLILLCMFPLGAYAQDVTIQGTVSDDGGPIIGATVKVKGLTDAEDEHEYWLTGEVPNLFDANNSRKWAYKGVCDGFAGEDLGLKYGGDEYKAYYEKQNVSETVK